MCTLITYELKHLQLSFDIDGEKSQVSWGDLGDCRALQSLVGGHTMWYDKDFINGKSLPQIKQKFVQVCF